MSCRLPVTVRCDAASSSMSYGLAAGLELEAEARAAETLLGALTALIRGCGPVLITDGHLAYDMLKLAGTGGVRGRQRWLRGHLDGCLLCVCGDHGDLGGLL